VPPQRARRPASAPISPASTTPAPAAAAGPLQTHHAPPALNWQYRLQQAGQVSGTAWLRWQPENGRYRLSLERHRDDGRPLPVWRSQGGFDALGLAPERFAHQRRGRDSQAANFRREQGLISFSASAELVELPAGAQDRLSWMLQLAALLAANPGLREIGTQIALPVASLRGAAMDWAFIVVGSEDLQLPIGPVGAALRLERPALGPYEPRIEAWLDPARHYLPVRLRHAQGEDREWELLLQTEQEQP
jgi:hypothetical protein